MITEHSPSSPSDLERWPDRLNAAIAEHGVGIVDRVMVVAETRSTQDLCRAAAGVTPGLLVVAGRQTAGRGRLGRTWADTRGSGLAATFGIRLGLLPAPSLSLAAGLAACRAIEAALAAANPERWRVGVRWPNDVVAIPPDDARDRKLCGVLIEPTPDLVLVGVGINVRQADSEFPEGLRHKATSLAMLGSGWSRLEVLERLLVELDAAIRLAPEELARQWQDRDTLVGTRRSFTHGRRRVDGHVEAIQPASHIRVRTDEGDVVELPALTTNLVHHSRD